MTKWILVRLDYDIWWPLQRDFTKNYRLTEYSEHVWIRWTADYFVSHHLQKRRHISLRRFTDSRCSALLAKLKKGRWAGFVEKSVPDVCFCRKTIMVISRIVINVNTHEISPVSKNNWRIWQSVPQKGTTCLFEVHQLTLRMVISLSLATRRVQDLGVNTMYRNVCGEEKSVILPWSLKSLPLGFENVMEWNS